MKKLSIQTFELAKVSIAEDFNALSIDTPYEESAKVIDKKMKLMLLAQEMYVSEVREETTVSPETTNEVDGDLLEEDDLCLESMPNMKALAEEQWREEEEEAIKKKEKRVEKSEEKPKKENEDNEIQKASEEEMPNLTKDIEITSDDISLIKPKEDFSEPVKYEFTRNLRGGHLNEIQAHVPESVVRMLNIEHGDLLHASKQKDQPKDSNMTYYDFELARKKSVGDRTGRRQYNLCPVESKEQQLVVHTSIESGPIMSKGEEVVIEILEDDIQNFRIKDGDLVDIAFYEDSLSRVQVIWRHKIEERTTKSHPIETNNRNQGNAKNNNRNQNRSKKPQKQKLEGVSIAVIGEAHNRQSYRMQVERYGGTLFMLDGKDSTLKIRQNVAKADIIMCVIGTCSHNGMEISREEAKKQGKPFIPVFTNSAATLVKIAIENTPNI